MCVQKKARTILIIMVHWGGQDRAELWIVTMDCGQRERNYNISYS